MYVVNVYLVLLFCLIWLVGLVGCISVESFWLKDFYNWDWKEVFFVMVGVVFFGVSFIEIVVVRFNFLSFIVFKICFGSLFFICFFRRKVRLMVRVVMYLMVRCIIVFVIIDDLIFMLIFMKLDFCKYL